MVTIQNLCFSYKKKKVFDNLNLEFSGGHVYGLLGKNGTGKSTLLQNIAGLLYPKGGSITVHGLTPSDRLPLFLSDVFMVPEEFYLPDISIENFWPTRRLFTPHSTGRSSGLYVCFPDSGRQHLAKHELRTKEESADFFCTRYQFKVVTDG
jgi:ABC-2 type transport system ATP-binding protein